MIPAIKIDQDMKTLQEISKFLQIHEMTIYRWIKAGKIPARRVGGRWRFSMKEIDTWMLSRRNIK